MNNDNVIEQLRLLGLGTEAAKLYLELLKSPSNHLRLAHATGINRTKVYRIADDLEKRSLITKRTDDRGTFLVAADPSTLEVSLVTQEEKLKAQRLAFEKLAPILSSLKTGDTSSFVVHTYAGTEGFQQMLWHELKAKDELLLLGSGTITDLVPNERWGNKHRAMTVQADYTMRKIINPNEEDRPFTYEVQFMHRFTHRTISKDILLLESQVSIYNDTVATYHWRNEQKVGVEIINKTYAQMMRQMFEHYWQLAEAAQK